MMPFFLFFKLSLFQRMAPDFQILGAAQSSRRPATSSQRAVSGAPVFTAVGQCVFRSY